MPDWEETHCYLLCGTNDALLIDTGLGMSNIRKVVDDLTELPVIVVTTHVHWDHIGGHKYFENIAVHEAEKDWLSVRFPIPLQVVKKNLTMVLCDFPEDFDLDAYQIFQGTPQRILYDGDSLDLGERTIQVIHTPGHSVVKISVMIHTEESVCIRHYSSNNLKEYIFPESELFIVSWKKETSLIYLQVMKY